MLNDQMVGVNNISIQILLVNPFSNFKVMGVPFKLPNSSVASVYAIAKNAGFEVELCDYQILDEPIIEYIDNFLFKRKYNIIGISVGIDVLDHVSKVITYIKKGFNNITIVIGGFPLTYQPELWMEVTGADIGVIGEAEETIAELFPKILMQSDLSQVKGIIYKSTSGKHIRTSPREIPKLDRAPFPDYSLFDIEPYFKNPYFKWLFNNKRGLYLISSRGCPYKCSFCCSGGGMRTYPTDRIEAEILKLVEKFHLNTLFIRDDIFTYNQNRARFISKVLGKTGISWLCMSRPDLLSREGDRELIEIMAQNGCQTIMIGVESYDQRVLDINLKDITLSEIDRAIENCRRAEIRTIAFLIFGLPGENEESIEHTMDFIRLNNIEVNINILQPLPGSKIYDDAVRLGKIKDELKYLREFHNFWDYEDIYLPVNMTSLPDEEIIRASHIANAIKQNK